MKTEKFPTPSICFAHRISYGETDTMGIVYYAEYFHIFERARDAYIRLSGMSYRAVEERGIYLPVREAQCRYRSPARFDDLILCRVGISKWGRASLSFVYEITFEDRSGVLVSGMTQHASTDGNGKPVPMPGWLKNITTRVPDGSVVSL